MGYLIAKIAVSKAIYSIDKPYDYIVPPSLSTTLKVGMRVLIPFGRGDRGSEGLVLGLSDVEECPVSLKSVFAQLDEEPILSQEGIRLTIWMREHYYCTSYDCARAMLPAGLFFALKDTLTLIVSEEEALEKAAPLKQGLRLVEYLIGWGGSGDMQQIRMAFGTKDPNSVIRFLLNEQIVGMEYGAKRNVEDKSDKVISLMVSPEEALAHVAPRRTTAPVRYAVVELLSQTSSATVKEVCYYTGATMQTVKSLVKSELVELSEQEALRSPHKEVVESLPPPILNQEQGEVLSGLEALLHKPAAALLYGVTGSGKTQVYIALIHKLIAQGKTALVLVPEISLTPQFLRIFTAQFGEKIAILHSGLRVGERYDEWKRVKRGDALVVLGTRSAVFAPLENIGVIIIDEEQETSYKSDRAPRYHARDIAKFRCVAHNALLLLGSATPSLDSMYRGKAGIYHLFHLTTRFNQGELPRVDIVDMKSEIRYGNAASVSTVLRDEILANKKAKEQSILFLNRRGTNRMLTCAYCGYVPECTNCDIRLTYHGANNRMMCHYCNFSEIAPPRCPKCDGGMEFIGFGTQLVEKDLEKFLREQDILRMDADTISAKNTHDQVLSKFQAENIPVLVGTQMVAKGLDFENVTLVGVIAGDGALFIDDIWAGERTFSLITQVVGRAGRGKKEGRAIIQTYTPDHDIIIAAANQDYDTFYENEIALRESRNYPPFRDVFVVSASGIQELQVLQTMTRIQRGLREGVSKIGENVTILGPAPASIPKINNRYRFQVTLMAEHTKNLRALLAHILTVAQKDKENKTVSIYIDHLI